MMTIAAETAAGTDTAAARPAGGPLLRVALAASAAHLAVLAIGTWVLLPRLVADDVASASVVPGDWVFPVVAFVVTVVGAVVVMRDASQRYGWVLFATGLVMGTMNAAGAYAVYARYVAAPSELPAAGLAGWLQDMLTWPGMALVVLLLPGLFPDGRPVGGRWGAALRATVGSWVAFTVGYTFVDRPLENWFLDLPDAPMNPLGFLPIPIDLLQGWWLLTMVASAVIALGSIVVRWRTAGRQLRQQLKWPAAGFIMIAVVVLADLGDVFLVYVVDVDLGVTWLVELAEAGATLLFVVTLGLGVLRYRLYDVDRVINRTVVYTVLVTVVTTAYVVGVVGLSRLVPSVSEEGLALGTTVVVAVAFDPVRRRLQALANRWMFGQRDEPEAVLAQLGEATAAAGTPAATLQTLVDGIAAALKLPWVAIELDQRDGQVIRAQHGHGDELAAVPWSTPLLHRGEEVGRLLAAPRSLREPLSQADQRLLTAISHQAGAVAATARLTRDLQQSREELVLAREEERRRIRRDLHDGLGPSLAAQTLALDAAADRIGDDPLATRDLLVALKSETQGLVADIRRLVHELRPPALDELGLTGALVAHVAQVDDTGVLAVRIRSEPDPLPELSAAVEVAAYRIVREAVTNVLRHAEATRCDVSLEQSEGQLELRIIDDGIGLPVVPGGGVGLRSMRERAEELGGTFSATDASRGGTEVRATLPLADVGVAGADRHRQEARHG